MKKITYLVAALLIGGSAMAQTNLLETVGSSNPVVIEQGERVIAACTLDVDSNALENGGFLGGDTNQLLAIDVDVDANTTLSIEKFTPTLIGPGTTFSINVYSDAAGLPGDLLDGVSVTAGDGVVTGNNFGFDFVQYELTLDTPYLLDGGADGAKYWVEMLSDADGWESSTADSDGLLGAFNNNNNGNTWAVGTSEYVYILEADCNDVLAVDSAALAQVSVYPNPATDVLNINVPSSVELNGVVLYDVLGKATNVTLSNGQINVSSLSRGMYILNVSTSAGTLTEKVIIE